MGHPALFLDRDGIINVDYGYVHKPDQVTFVDGIVDLIAAANRAGYIVVVVTNQAGIGRGFYTETDFEHLMAWMRGRLLLQGARIDAVYYCPYHPTHGVGEYCRESEFRKPGPGMLLQAAQEHDLDMQRSVFVGDRLSDMEAGRRAGVGTLLHFTEAGDGGPDIRISRLLDAIQYLFDPEQL